MIKFKMFEIPPQVQGFYGRLMRERTLARPEVWNPVLTSFINVEQEEETDQWVAFVHWELMGHSGFFPCREGDRGEYISRMDPPERFKIERSAELFGMDCESAFREQFDEWITGDHRDTYGKTIE